MFYVKVIIAVLLTLMPFLFSAWYKKEETHSIGKRIARLYRLLRKLKSDRRIKVVN